MDQYRSNQPNAAKLISSLRNTGYDSYAAVEDIIDNSIDAEARLGVVKRGGTQVVGGYEISYPLLQPWEILQITVE